MVLVMAWRFQSAGEQDNWASEAACLSKGDVGSAALAVLLPGTTYARLGF